MWRYSSGGRAPFFRLEGFGNTATFRGKIWFQRKDGYRTAALTGFARIESVPDYWRHRNPQWVDIWSLYYRIWGRKYLIPFGKVIRGFSISAMREGRLRNDIYIVTRGATTPEEREMHPRHPMIRDPLFLPE